MVSKFEMKITKNIKIKYNGDFEKKKNQWPQLDLIWSF